MLDEYYQFEARLLDFVGGAGGDFNSLALEVHRFQCRWNQPFANFCATRPEPHVWHEIPAVPQVAFKQFRLSVAPSELISKTFHTSGTTGEGFGRHCFLNTRLYEAAVRAGWEQLALPRRPHVVLVPRPEEAPHSSLSHMMAALEPLAEGTSWLLDGGGRLDGQFGPALEGSEPVAMLGTALSFVNAFDQLGDRRLRLPAGSFAMETGGYKGSGRDLPKRELYARFGEFLGLDPDDVINEYGMTELSSQCYARGLDRPHIAPHWLRAIVFHPESGREVEVGETGVLRLFDLANLGSVLGLETQDLAIRREEGFELLGRDPEAIPRGCSRQADEQWPRP